MNLCKIDKKTVKILQILQKILIFADIIMMILLKLTYNIAGF